MNCYNIIMKKYDVIIAGAGLAGLALAKELSGTGITVLVLDKKKRASEILYHSSGTFMAPGEYGLPERLFHPIKEVQFESRNQKCLKKVDGCYVVDRAGLYAWYEKEISRHDNVSLRFGCIITGIKTKLGRIESIKYSDKGRQVEAAAAVYADCTGLAAVLGRKTGLVPKKCVMAPGVEYLVPTKSNWSRAYFYVGRDIGGGYGWVFPKHYDLSIAGLGFIRKERFSTLEPSFQKMWESRNISEICKRRAIEKHTAALRTGAPLSRFVKGNLMVIGDSALQANPLIGEGIRFVLDAVKEAAVNIRMVFTSGNADVINNYGKDWRKKHLKRFRFSFFMQNVLRYATMNDWVLDCGVKVLKYCNEYQFRRVLSADISLSLMLFIVVQALGRNSKR